jgi:hypothetical protein
LNEEKEEETEIETETEGSKVNILKSHKYYMCQNVADHALLKPIKQALLASKITSSSHSLLVNSFFLSFFLSFSLQPPFSSLIYLFISVSFLDLVQQSPPHLLVDMFPRIVETSTERERKIKTKILELERKNQRKRERLIADQSMLETETETETEIEETERDKERERKIAVLHD